MGGAQAPSPTVSPHIPLASTPSPLPVLHELRISKDAEEWLRTLSPSTFQSYDQIQKAWNAPMTQFTLTVVQDAELKGAFSQIANSHQGSHFAMYEGVLIIAIWLLRAWRLSHVSTWFARLGTQAWIALVYWAFAAFLIPNFIWGAAYRTVLSHVAKAILVHFFA